MPFFDFKLRLVRFISLNGLCFHSPSFFELRDTDPEPLRTLLLSTPLDVKGVGLTVMNGLRLRV